MEKGSKGVYSHTVLAIDDDPLMLDVVTKYLTARGLRVVHTTDPEKVLALATQEKPQLIISDIAMPGMDGLTLLKAIRENTATQNIPLILLTSSQDPADMQEGLNSGADAYLLKPVDWDVAWPKIQAVLLRS